ncbi:MAG: hypothetical protein ACF8R9_09615 [Phycisphaerales bacterium JB054]
MPTAWGLREAIIAGIVPPRVGIHADDPHWRGIVSGQFSEMTEAFRSSGWSSIDRFLEKRPQFQRNGKIAIATKLVPLELEAVNQRRVCGDWYAWLFEAIDGSVDGWRKANLSVVTFNYDRTFEIGLTLMLANSGAQPIQEVWDQVCSLPIYHVYGALGNMIRFSSSSQVDIDRSPNGVISGAESIRIISDERANDDEVLQCSRRAVLSADRLIFLGFGFDETNLERIGITGHKDDWLHRPLREVFASAMGREGVEREVIPRRIGHDVGIGGTDDGCLDFLRKVIEF